MTGPIIGLCPDYVLYGADAMERLSSATLNTVPDHIVRPVYARQDMSVRIVHLGAGAFHRSHQAVYTDDIMQAGDELWGILSVSLRNPAITHALGPQDNLYTLLVRNHHQIDARIIGSIARTAYLLDERDTVLNALTSPQTQIVTLTITQRGYYHDAESDSLDLNHPDIQLDLNSPHNAGTAIGVLAWAIFRRKQLGMQPLTLLSCDNMAANGKVLQRVLEHYIERVQRDLGDRELLRHFLAQYACPCSLVDRDTPAIRAADLAQAEALLGVHDAAPVITEPFSQWVIQDWFSAGRPPWEQAGAVFAAHVQPYEQMHERLLGGAQCALAYLGTTAGYKTAHEAMQAPDLAQFIDDLMVEAAGTLPRLAKPGWQDYKARLMLRFANPAVERSIAQLAMDATLVLPGSILEPMRIRLSHGLPIDRHALVVAAWIRCLTGLNERLEELFINDPMRNELLEAIRKAGGRTAGPHDLVDAVLGIKAVFGDSLPQDMEFVRCITAALQSLLEDRSAGALAALAAADHTQ
ncbi:mannitol dehydrogenase family protein [Pusillimonas sp.]|uniref:mannitol dehydrogenase family protein n=1 Tax=Pusillimonas sp. TaxID=3040095 RepID=UPI0037C84061